jgi:hypothetical protein
MADNKNLTIFQRLGQVLGPDSAKLKQSQPQPKRYNLGSDVLLKTDSKADFEKAKLQAQQNKYLGQMWKKVENGLFQQSINYETTRIGSYSDFEAMEFYPIIAAALDIMAEESTTLNDKGKVLNVYSDSSRVKGILEDLFFNRLDIHTSLPMWTRNMVKYGDNFVFLNIDDVHGITGTKQMPNYEMERRESGLFDMITGREKPNADVAAADKVKFYWRGSDVEFNSWQIAHFRLTGDDRRLPYGTSILEKARRIWKQCVHEDTLIWTDFGYKKIKNLTTDDVIYSYDFNDKKLVKTNINDVWQTGEKETFLLKTRYNNIKLTDNHPILIFDGKSYSYKTLKEINIGKDYLVTPVNKKGKDKIKIHEKIISYESIGVHSVWDLTTENELHNFIGDGIVVHNCILSEDSMLVYRVTRAPERRVYKIYVGNIDDADVPAYVNEIADRFKRTPIVDPQTGQMDLRYNQLSNDQDFFIPVRSEDAPNPIDTLPGANNLDQIADIQYLRENLFTALRVPKPFLGFDETTGDGKNLALQDIRFSRTINRIQQSMLQELNKIAIIHLYLLGFEEDFDNFTLTLNNPSTQAEMLKIEHLQSKVTLYKDAVSDSGNGFGAMSMTRAKRDILGMSDDDIKQDLLEQRLEKAAAAELANSANVIKHTGMFDVVDRVYGDFKTALEGGGGEGAEAGGEEGGGASGGGGGGGLGGSFGGGGFGGEDLDFGAEEGEAEAATEAGGEAEAAGEVAGAEEEATEAGAEEAAPTEVTESIKNVNKLLTEQKQILSKKLEDRTKKYRGRFVDTLLESIEPVKKDVFERVKIYDKNVKINKDVNDMINGIDKMLGE